MTILQVYNQIEKDRIALYKDITKIFKAGESHPAFTIKNRYEQFIISIFKYCLMSLYPNKFLVTYVTGNDYNKVSHAFKSWYMKMTNGNIEHWLSINHLTDSDKFVKDLPIKANEVYHQRYIKALEIIENAPYQDVLYKMMNIVELS